VYFNFGDLLTKNGIDPAGVLVLRHRPTERELRKVLPWLVSEHQDVFNTYQATQNPRAEAAMAKAVHVASFIGEKPGRALFVGLYVQNGSKTISDEAFKALPEYQILTDHGMKPDPDLRRLEYKYFDLQLTDLLSSWRGRLIVGWPPPELGWYRWAGNNTFPVETITEKSLLVKKIPHWKELALTFDALKICPEAWRDELRRWRGIYFIFDKELRQGYVGSAYNEENIWQRWAVHMARGGDAKKLKRCDAKNFIFTILEITSHDMAATDIIQLETNWKSRLHTIEYGLNDN
jgi:hypothetical protein